MIRFRRIVQIFCLFIFLALLTTAAVSEISFTSLDIFLRMDPALVVISAVSTRVLLPIFLPALIVILSGPILGRIFCGYICPMGITLDGTDVMFGPRKTRPFFSKYLLTIKYYVLVFLLGSAIIGVSYAFFAVPLSLITRLYGLIFYPVLSFSFNGALDIIRPAADSLDLHTISYAEIKTIRFATQFFILFFFAGIIAMVRFSPRFWCRYLCPSGALMALVSQKPIIGRQVSDQCNECGKCHQKCPMSAIEKEMPKNTLYSECIVCRTCQEVCPEDAISFTSGRTNESVCFHSPTRRQFVSTGLIGAGTAVMTLTNLHSLHGKPGEGQVTTPGLIRPPGSIPEMDFLSRCVRCGECMVACPTNTLQPIWFNAGFASLFSPAITPKRGYCSPQCHNCSAVCPTDAIRSISSSERIWTKLGTARIIRQKCLAWEFEKSCMVCDEVCPYDAIGFQKEKNNKVPVPYIFENKCAGCGYCEHFCPVQNQSAIVVTPMDELRLKRRSYEQEGRLKGFSLQLKPTSSQLNSPVEAGNEVPDLAPGFDAE